MTVIRTGQPSEVRLRDDSGRLTELTRASGVRAKSGSEANAEMQARYLGPGGDLVKGRGTAFNTGDGLQVIGIVRLPRLSAVSAGVSLPPVSQFSAGNRRHLERAPKTCSDLSRVGLGQIGWGGEHANEEE
ncbi:hypothetical protein [Mycobacterium sp. URHB0021]